MLYSLEINILKIQRTSEVNIVKKEGNNENTRDRIIRIASDIIKDKGFKNTTVKDICLACDISKRTFYYHINSKDDIILEYYDKIIDDITPLLMQMLSTNNYWEQIVLIFNNLITSMESLGPDINAQLLSINLQGNKNIFDMRQDLADVAINIIEEAQQINQVRNKNKASDLYRSAAYMFTGYEYMWCVRDGDFPWRQQLLSSLETIFDVDPELRKYSES